MKGRSRGLPQSTGSIIYLSKYRQKSKVIFPVNLKLWFLWVLKLIGEHCAISYSTIQFMCITFQSKTINRISLCFIFIKSQRWQNFMKTPANWNISCVVYPPSQLSKKVDQLPKDVHEIVVFSLFPRIAKLWSHSYTATSPTKLVLWNVMLAFCRVGGS